MGRALATDLSSSLCAELLSCGSASQILARFNIRFHPLTTVANSPPEKTSYRVATLLTLEFTLPLPVGRQRTVALQDGRILRCRLLVVITKTGQARTPGPERLTFALSC